MLPTCYTSSVDTEPEQAGNRPITANPATPPILAPEPTIHGTSITPVAKKGHRWQPGQSGNPAGRKPKGTDTLTGVLREKADKRKLAERLLELAYKGDVVALRYVYDRIDGTPVQRTEDVTPDKLRSFAQPIADALGVPVQDVLAQYEQLRQLHPGT